MVKIIFPRIERFYTNHPFPIIAYHIANRCLRTDIHLVNWLLVSVLNLRENVLLSLLEETDIILFHRSQLFHIVVRNEIFLCFPNHLEGIDASQDRTFTSSICFCCNIE